MSESLVLLGLVLVMAAAFDFINGFHDTANAIATVVATRVLSPRQAIAMAAGLNFLGALSGTAVATTLAKGIVDPSAVTQTVIVAALGSAILWNLITWYFGIPSSSSHALIGGVVGGALAFEGTGALNRSGLEAIILTLITSPLIGMVIGFLLMILLLWIVFRQSAHTVNDHFRRLQLISSAFMSFSHGSNDAQKTMGIMGVGASKRLSAVRWGVAGDMVVAWILTIPATATVAWLIYEAFTVGGRVVGMVRPF